MPEPARQYGSLKERFGAVWAKLLELEEPV
jgi:hypothetical protein